MVLRALGDLAGARKVLAQTLAIDEKAFGPDHPSVARDVRQAADFAAEDTRICVQGHQRRAAAGRLDGNRRRRVSGKRRYTKPPPW